MSNLRGADGERQRRSCGIHPRFEGRPARQGSVEARFSRGTSLRIRVLQEVDAGGRKRRSATPAGGMRQQLWGDYIPIQVRLSKMVTAIANESPYLEIGVLESASAVNCARKSQRLFVLDNSCTRESTVTHLRRKKRSTKIFLHEIGRFRDNFRKKQNEFTIRGSPFRRRSHAATMDETRRKSREARTG